MKEYPVNEIFYSLQGEGVNAGKPAIFIRFSGCNLRCPFCDTEHLSHELMSIDRILEKIETYTPCRFVVLTGGEPSLFIDENFISRLAELGFNIAIETNGTHELPDGINHVTMSPKDDFCPDAKPVLQHCDELKVVYCGQSDLNKYDNIKATERLIQPCDTENPEQNSRLIDEAVKFCKANPQWRLSLQLHKILNIR